MVHPHPRKSAGGETTSHIAQRVQDVSVTAMEKAVAKQLKCICPPHRNSTPRNAAMRWTHKLMKQTPMFTVAE